jgi:hypothetical protein
MAFLLIRRGIGRFGGVEVLLERVESGRPQVAVGREPLVEGLERLGAEAVQPTLGVGPDVDEAGLPQDPKVLGDSRLAQAQQFDQFAHRVLVTAEPVEDAASVGLGQHLEGSHQPYITSRLYAWKAI